MRTRTFSRLASESGFTLIECLVAAVVLIIGLLGTFAMLDGASGAEGASSTREGATNIAREFLETIRGDAYTAVDAAELTNVLQAMPGYVPASSPPVIRRRNINYSITATVCSVDDPKDGTATTSTPAFCQAGTASSPADNQPDDLKQVRITVTWTGRRAGNVAEAAMLSSSGAVIGLPTQSLVMEGTANPAPTITTASTSCGAGLACFDAAATGATAIKFSVDGTDRSTPATGVPMTASCATGPSPCAKFSWDYSTLSDGTYRIAARSVDANGVEGQPKYMVVKIARNPALTAVTGLRGGYNYLPPTAANPPSPTAIFEISWDAKPERNVIGYTVTRGGSTICDLDAQGRIKPTPVAGLEAYSCVDMSPPAPSTTPATYTVTATYADLTGGPNRVTPAVTVSQAGQTAATTSWQDVQKSFGLNNRAPAYGCTKDMVDGYTGTGANVASGVGPITINFCSPAVSALFPSASAVEVKGPVDVDMTLELNASGTKKCHMLWALSHDTAVGSTAMLSNGASGLTFTGGGTHITTALDDANALANVPVPLAEHLKLAIQLATAVGATNCNVADLRFNGLSAVQPGNPPAPGRIQLWFHVGTPVPPAPFARPSAPTSLSSSLAGTDKTLNWSGPAGASFYRIYRDGQLLKDRYDTCDVGDTAAGGCDKGGNNFSYLDAGAGGGHTYYVSTVGAAGSPMAESPEVQVP